MAGRHRFQNRWPFSGRPVPHWIPASKARPLFFILSFHSSVSFLFSFGPHCATRAKEFSLANRVDRTVTVRSLTGCYRFGISVFVYRVRWGPFSFSVLSVAPRGTAMVVAIYKTLPSIRSIGGFELSLEHETWSVVVDVSSISCCLLEVVEMGYCLQIFLPQVSGLHILSSDCWAAPWNWHVG